MPAQLARRSEKEASFVIGSELSSHLPRHFNALNDSEDLFPVFQVVGLEPSSHILDKIMARLPTLAAALPTTASDSRNIKARVIQL